MGNRPKVAKEAKGTRQHAIAAQAPAVETAPSSIRHPKSVFRPVYFLLATYTFYTLAMSLISGIQQAPADTGIYTAVNGDENIGTIRVFYSFLAAAVSCYLMTIYIVMEAHEEGLSIYDTAVTIPDPSAYANFLDYLLRFAVVAGLIYLSKFGKLEEMANAWRVLTVLSAGIFAWLLVLGFFGKDTVTTNRNYRFNLGLTFATSILALILTLASMYGLQGTYGLIVFIFLFLMSLVLAGSVGYFVTQNFAKLTSIAWDWAFVWK